jgi:hypothetical protein
MRRRSADGELVGELDDGAAPDDGSAPSTTPFGFEDVFGSPQWEASLMPAHVDITGRRFGRLTAVS